MSEARLTGEAVAALLNTRMEGVTDQIAKSCPLFNDLKTAGKVKFGKGWVDGAEFYVHYQNSLKASVKGVGDWEQAKATTANDRVKITIPGANLTNALATSALRDERLDNLDDKTKMWDLLLEEQAALKQALMETFCEDLYNDGTQRSTDTLAPIVGLEGIIDDANTYASRVRGTDTWWKAQVKTAAHFLAQGTYYAGQYDGIALMNQIANQIQLKGYTDANGTPAGLPNKNADYDSIYADVNAKEMYAATFESRMEFRSQEKQDARQMLAFDGKPIKVDAFCTANRFYFVNWKSFEFWSTKKNGELFNIICKDQTNLVQSLVMNSQHCFFNRQPRHNGKLKITAA